ncbi:hypothetical protein [Paraburkholderia azotifigens]
MRGHLRAVRVVRLCGRTTRAPETRQRLILPPDSPTIATCVVQILNDQLSAQKDFANTGRRIAPLIAKRAVFSDDRIMRRIDGSHFWVTVCGFGFNPKRPYELALWTFSDLSLKDKHSDFTTLLTARERDVAALVVHGMTSKEIGKERRSARGPSTSIGPACCANTM